MARTERWYCIANSHVPLRYFESFSISFSVCFVFTVVESQQVEFVSKFEPLIASIKAKVVNRISEAFICNFPYLFIYFYLKAVLFLMVAS